MILLPPKAKGALIAFIGYILSPLSWYNDLVVNIPLAYAFALFVGLFFKHLFTVALIIGYWLTNIVGLLMMHYGALTVAGRTSLTRKELTLNVAVSLLYTLAMVFLIQKGILKFPTEYFRK